MSVAPLFSIIDITPPTLKTPFPTLSKTILDFSKLMFSSLSLTPLELRIIFSSTLAYTVFPGIPLTNIRAPFDG